MVSLKEQRSPEEPAGEAAGLRVVPTSARGQRTRATIVAAARTIFETRGYADTNVAAITTEAGVGYGSFYVYFSSKEEVFAEVARQLQEDVFVRSRSRANAHDPYARIEAENRRYFELYRENARMIQMIEEVGRISAEFRQVLLSQRHMYIGRSAAGIARLQKQHRVDPDLDPTSTAEALGAMVERMAYLCSQDDALDPEQVQATIQRLWTNAIGLKPDPAPGSN